MTLEGKFLKRKYWGGEKFRETIGRSVKREIGKIPPQAEEQINLYLQRLYKGLSGKELSEEKIRKDFPERFKNFIINKIEKEYFFNPQKIGDDKLNEIFKNIIIGNFAELKGYTLEQLRNPQIKERIIKQWEKETGQNFDTYQISQERKQELIEQTIQDQKASLERWFNYFLSPEAENYPLEFRYWVFIEMLKCGGYDGERKTFSKRTKLTIAPFPYLNQQALSLVLDEIIRKQKKEPSQLLTFLQNEAARKEFEKRLQSENFADLYGFTLNYVKSLIFPSKRLPIIRGEWKMFKRGSNPKELTATIRNFLTGWCIAGEGTASSYLSFCDIHIYFSEDKDGNLTIPRVAIVYSPFMKEILEIRGIAELQNIDPYIHPVVEEKLNEFHGGKEWIQTMNDQKKLAEIYLKHLSKQKLTLEELTFIYEIDKDIESFGYNRDPRIDEILTARNNKKDLSLILKSRGIPECKEEEIATSEKEINDNTKAIWTKIKNKLFALYDMPKNLVYVMDSLDLKYSPVKSLGKLRKVDWSLYLTGSQVEDLGDLEEVGICLDLRETPVKSLGKLKKVGGGLYLTGSQVEDLGDLEEVRICLDLGHTPIKSLGKLKKVLGTIIFTGSQVEDLGDLEEVGDFFDLKDTRIKSLGKLRKVDWSLYLTGSQVEDLGDLEEVGEKIIISSKQKRLKRLLIQKGFGDKIEIEN